MPDRSRPLAVAARGRRLPSAGRRRRLDDVRYLLAGAVVLVGVLAMFGGHAYDTLVLDGTRGNEVCLVHKEPLRRGLVKIRYGLIRPGNGRAKGYGDACRNEFPRAREYYPGGCVVGEKRWAKISYCPPCRSAKASWLAEHQID